MSREPTQPEPGDDVVDRLLPMSEDPPQLDPDARARLLRRLQRSRQDELAAPAPPPAGPRDPEPVMSSAKPARIRPIYTYALAVAASGLLVWGASSYLSEKPGSEDPAQHDPLLATDLVNDAARPRLVTLADGSTIVLRQGTTVHVDGPRRLHLRRGEALIEVVPGSQPFTVHSGAGEVEVRGTKFLLRQADDGLLAGVLRGELRLWNPGGEAIVQAGELAHLPPGAAPTKRPSERLSHEIAWARDALAETTEGLQAVRRGNLVAKFPTWNREWPLPVRVMDVDVHVEDGVARTTIDQTFFNHTDYELEGVYSFPLPSDAAIARLAMYVDGKLMEAGITERQEGREIYESIVYRRRDPALLEWMQGNEFRMRVFPLPARTEKRILLSYTQPLESLYGDYSVRVPIPELDLPVGTLRYRVHVKDRTLSVDSCCVEFTTSDRGDERIAEATLHDVPIGEDLALTLYPTQKPPAVTMATKADPGGDYVMVRARPELPQSSQHVPRRWVVLHDTSASRSPQELAAQTRFLRHLLRELDEADRITLLAFDSTVRPLPGGFTRVDALDPAAVERFLAREGRDHVGASRLALAVDEALALLAADAGPEAPHILYLGDGLLGEPGDAARTALRERLAPAAGARATFVAAAVGDEHDLPLLDDLAGATGGMRVLLTAGADLRWQALDLAAALNTSRVHGLRASLLGPDGEALPGAVHLSAGSAADGEAIVVLSRGTGSSRQVPKTMVLTGTLAGAAWTQRHELPAAKTDAGYLPRLWARAQIEADVRAGAEAHKEEITRLGREHFLVTPFTSLLVLENEAMYKQFNVRRPDAAGWAHYDAPAEIEVVKEPRGAVEATAGQLVQRRPIGLVSDGPPQYGMDVWGGVDDGLNIGGGLGLWGVGRGGGGSGEGTIGLGLTGLIGKGGGGTGSGYGRGASAGFGGRGTRVPAVRLGDVSFGPSVPTSATPDPAFVTAGELARRVGDWQRDAASESVASPAVASKEVARTDAVFMPQFESQRRGRGHGWVGGRGQPLALQHIGDVRLGDLGEHVPALFEDGFDREREQLLAATAASPGGQISADARDLVTRARSGLAPARYAVDHGGVLAIEADGKFTRTREIGKYLREVTRYDGDTLVASYPELGLAATRRVGLAEPALLAQWAPWLLPSADSLARWYDVERRGSLGLRLRQRGSEDTIDLELDEQLRLVAMTRRSGDEVVGETRFEYDDRGLTIVAGDERVRVERTDAAVDTSGLDAISTTVTLPLRSEVDLDAELARTTAGSPEWRAVQRQRLAVLAALGQSHRQAAVLAELRPHGPLTRGELVLAGAGILHAEPKLADPLLAQLPADPVARYLAALRKARKGQTSLLEQVAKDSSGTLPGLLASHARLLADTRAGVTPQSLARLKQLLATYDSPELAFIATNQLAGRYNWMRPAAAAPAWEALAAASPTWAPVALHAAGTAYQYAGDVAEAGKRFEAGLAAAVDGGQLPIVDWSVRSTIDRAGGQAGWRLQWSRWRAAVQKSGDAHQLIGFINAAQTLGDTDEIHRVLVGADLEHIDPAGGAQLVLLLARAGLLADAQVVLRPLLAAAPREPGLLALAAILAEHQGDLVAAADLGERALAGRGDLPLGQLRNAYRTLLDLRARIATSHRDLAKPGAGERDPIDLALDVAARWRAEDPDNAEIDERCASLLFSVGQPAEALRHLDSIAERHPADGSAHARVARVLEREGRFDEADQRWQQAAAVEPTDPTWLLGRAHNRLATGDAATARTLVERVVAGDWQDRFFMAESEARQLKKQFDAPAPR